MGSFGRFSLISCLTTTTTTHTHSLSSRSLSQYVSLQYHIHQLLISPPHHRHTSGHPEIDAAPESRYDDPDDDTASYAYMRCNAMQQCILQDMLHLMVQLTHVSHTHTKFLRNLILRPFHVSPFPCLCLSVFVSRGIKKKRNHPSLPSSL